MYIVLFLIGCALISFVAYHVIAYRNPISSICALARRDPQDYPHDKAMPSVPQERLECLL